MPVEVASQADISYQDELWIGRKATAGSTFTYTQILGVETVTPPEMTPEEEDVTHQQSPGRTRETVAGLLAAVDLSQELQFWPQHPSQIMLDELADLAAAGEPEDVHVVMVVGGLLRANRAQVRSFTPTGTVGSKRMASVALKIFEPITPKPVMPTGGA